MVVLEGTFGYVAPEVVETGKMSAEADVFSFGVLVLEVACGRRAIAGGDNNDDGDSDGDGNERVLVDDVWERHGDGRLLDAADRRLKGCFDAPEMECLLRLGLLCTLPDPASRPSMSEIRSILRSERPAPPLPPRPPPPAAACSSSIAAAPYIADEIHRSLQISIDELLSS
jgi:serine/threonine protein kinase